MVKQQQIEEQQEESWESSQEEQVKKKSKQKKKQQDIIASNLRKDLGLDCEMIYFHQLISSQKQQEYMDQILTAVNLQQFTVRIVGRMVSQPRLSAYFSDPDLPPYKYSGLQVPTKSWEECPLLLQIKETVESALGFKFNSVLINYYRDGQDSIGWHSDDESLYGDYTIIASLSFGARRDFVVRNVQNNRKKYYFQLGEGALLAMKGKFQKFWQHCVPKRKQAERRLSLTFRKVLQK